MIYAKCPLRISLAGGSSDLEDFINLNGRGSVISFPCNLYTYITLFTDKNGFNKWSKEYIVDYTVREQVNEILSIRNDVAREALNWFQTRPMKISFYSDIFSEGSGLASSSAYVVSLIKALCIHKGENISTDKICQLALEIERKFNPLTGRQDPYGCGVGGLKRMDFGRGRITTHHSLKSALLKEYDKYLIYTGVKRSSTKILESLNLEKIKGSLDCVDEMDYAISSSNENKFFEMINKGWLIKKETSNLIALGEKIMELDFILESHKDVKAHRLCGAGGGGYFLVFVNKGVTLENKIKNFDKISFKIDIDEEGVVGGTI